MRHVWGRALAAAAFAILLVAAPHLMTVEAQPPVELDPRVGRAFVMIRQAEAAGATQNETSSLVALLNRVLELQDSLNATPSNEKEKRAALRARVDQQLTDLETKAAQLWVVASQRTQMSNILAYVSGGIVAVLATVAYAYGLSFWRKYRVKRTFQMRISPK